MILEGFEIEHWSCIRRVAVDGLSPTGVIVLHGPNGTGKSSIIEALRACLMDNKSTSKALGRAFHKNSAEKPRVSVTFRADGASWRITKQFNSKESKLESRTESGSWKQVTADPSESHERVRQLTGGCESRLGLHQLLWLTQAEFHLPGKGFDADVQSRLRSVLGVLQTPLDDRFLARLKEQWSQWFSARSKPGEAPRPKKDCSLDKALTLLQQAKTELAEVETRYQEFEALVRRSGELEVELRELRRQRQEKTTARESLQGEYDRSLKRLEEYRQATRQMEEAAEKREAARALKKQREDGEKSIVETERLARKAGQTAEEKRQALRSAEQRLRGLRQEVETRQRAGRDLQGRLDEVNERRQLLVRREQVRIAREKVKLAEAATAELEALQHQARERPAPDAQTLKKLEANRDQAARRGAELEAAALALTLNPQPGAAAPRLVIDGVPEQATDGAPGRHAVRRRVEITIPGWGRVELTRGADARSLDEIERELHELDRAFAEGLAPFGLTAGDAAALDVLRNRSAEKKVRDTELLSKQQELKRLAPHGLDPLRQEVARLERLQQAGELAAEARSGLGPLPLDAAELERITADLKKDIEDNNTAISALSVDVAGLEREIESEAVPGNKRTPPGLRRQEAVAREQFTTLDATAKVQRQNLDRLPTAEQIGALLQDAETAFDLARQRLEAARLNESEATIRERLDAADEGLRVLHGRLTDTEKEFHRIEGALRLTEGWHQKRAAAAVRVEELEQQIKREQLESRAVDRLYALFEECREKRFNTVMQPIHDRLVRWIRLLRIGTYKTLHFNDQLLPEKLITDDGAVELSLEEESTGTIEQIGMMVRLALGSVLSSREEPAVAVLDDPLTHSDVVRLDRMRAVLKSASLGDGTLVPPAGPLQILVFTCHPEWFAIDGAQTVDLAKPEILTRMV